MAYCKLSSSIVTSSIWNEPIATRVVWITFLALKNQDGFVEGVSSSLCRVANVTREDFDIAIKTLEAPDIDSKNPANDGKRIEKTDGGWIVLNHENYREMHSDSPSAIRVRKHRALHSVTCNKKMLHPVTPVYVSESVSESVSEPVKKKKPTTSDLPLAFSSDNFRAVWDNWLQHRKEKRSPLTPKTHEGQTAMLAAMSEDMAIACINQSIKNGWTGLFELKGNLNGEKFAGNNRSGAGRCDVRPGFGDQIDEDAIRRASARKFAKILGEPDPHPESERPWADVRV